jgi:hypothetical protein
MIFGKKREREREREEGKNIGLLMARGTMFWYLAHNN